MRIPIGNHGVYAFICPMVPPSTPDGISHDMVVSLEFCAPNTPSTGIAGLTEDDARRVAAALLSQRCDADGKRRP